MVDFGHTPLICRTEYYGDVPKHPAENVAYRRLVIESAASSPKVAEEIWIRCRRDILYYINVFGWTFNPRIKPPLTPWVPFITYDYQDDLIIDVLRVMGEEDLLVEKSRDMGASWCLLLPIIWLWHFFDDQSFLLLSRTEDYVDKAGNPKSLFWKVEEFVKRLPAFLRPMYSKTHMHIHNEDTGATIDGESTTGDAARGDRRLCIMLDEFAAVDEGDRVLASSRDTTDTRLFNSTPKGARGAFYDMRQTEIRTHRLHWTMHPDKSKGLYKDSQGKPRSPWYDLQCKRAAHPMEIAQELDIDYHASDSQFFNSQVLQNILDNDVQTPMFVGDLLFDADCTPTEFRKSENGPLRLWIPVHDHVLPSAAGKSYVMGIDVATGTQDGEGRGSSNSTMSIVEADTGEKVGEYAISGLDPPAFAKVCVAVGKWFNQAFLIWESNGPGALLGQNVLATGYERVFYRPRNPRSVRQRPSDTPGWNSNNETKLVLIGEYAKALTDGTFKNRSHLAIMECRSYVYIVGGGVAHSRALSKGLDPSGARANHGDRVIADALAYMLVSGTGEAAKPEAPPPVEGTLAARKQERIREAKMVSVW